MQLVVDVGNTETVIGLTDQPLVMKAHWRVSSVVPRTVDEMTALLRALLAGDGARQKVFRVYGSPMEEENPDQVKDLASFVAYEDFIPNAECDPKLTAALLAYEEDLDNDCGDGISISYEAAATAGHYFNYAIVRYFHLSAIGAALVLRKDRLAEQLLTGLVTRVDTMMADDDERADNAEWDADAAGFLLAAAANGLPLTAAEARLVQEVYSASVDHYLAYQLWDLWDPSVADGEYSYIPSRDAADGAKHVRLPEMSFLFEYCYSPFRNPASVELVDCSVILDPSRWGE